MVSSAEIRALRHATERLLDRLEDMPHRKFIFRALRVITELSQREVERLDWKLMSGALEDMERGLKVFHPYRRVRKVSIFGSARMGREEPEYQQAVNFARCITECGFMVLTGAGGGIMAAGNEGAGQEHSFGLNISLPFEQSHNEFIDGSDRLIEFRYFFTRKLFFLKESDAIALFPGGFGTQDEFFECLTLCQTGKSTPKPLVLIDKVGGDYWRQWDAYIANHLVKRNLISPEDRYLYYITDDVGDACESIKNFYKVYHSSRWVDDLLVIRLCQDISDADLRRLNREFSDIVVKGEIEKSKALAKEKNEPHLLELPRLLLYFDQRSYGRLQQLILALNACATTHSPTMPCFKK
ncbi:MAG: LOG family protein [Pseudanabaenaceae cyanobacterium SKYGB_i_bin29]|nr:LOG family protein [Pseudanabaenaceae cyanobacterium SKYG29]MDW8422667.1 LOG family protein [Pseudanabaenaceae cyanobacterium SKYGB_i_bin29]